MNTKLLGVYRTLRRHGIIPHSIHAINVRIYNGVLARKPKKVIENDLYLAMNYIAELRSEVDKLRFDINSMQDFISRHEPYNLSKEATITTWQALSSLGRHLGK